MNWLDAAIIIVLVVLIILGFRRGLIGSAVPLAGIVLGIVLAGRFYGSVAMWLSTWLHSEAQAKIAGFAVIFVLVMLAAAIIATLLRRFLSLLLPGWVDRVGGLAFGLIMGAVVCGASLALASKFFASPLEGAIEDAVLAGFFLDRFPFILGLLPHQFDSVRQLFG